MKKETIQMFRIGLKLCLICAVAAVSLSILNEITEPVIERRKILEEAEVVSILVPALAEIGEKVTLKDKDKDKENGKEKKEERIVLAYYPVKEAGSIPGYIRAYYNVKEDVKISGYILELNAQGYGGDMKIIASYKKDGEILAVQLMDNEETPGLGKFAEEPSYMEKFKGTGGGIGREVPVSKEMLKKNSSGISIEHNEMLRDKGYGSSISFWEWFLGKPTDQQADTVTGATITFEGIGKALAAGSKFVKSLSEVRRIKK